jgi:TRAP-type C4-dicarboxylate transport system substrate-binding protein
MRVLHNGSEGSEEKMLLSMRGNNIQAGIFTSFGLSSINPSVMTMSMPFFIRNSNELTAVMREVQDDLESRLNSGDFFLIAWSKAGFVNIFSREPVFVPDDLRRLRVASDPMAGEMNNSFKSMGFSIIESDMTDMGQRISQGTVTAVYQNPAGIAAFQMHTMLRHMLPVNIAPILGGIVMNQVTWRRIGTLNPRYQQELLRATRRISDEFDSTMQRTVDDAVRTMTRGGLVVNQPNRAQEQLWYDEVDKVIPSLLGTTYDRDLYQKINTILVRYRGR